MRWRAVVCTLSAYEISLETFNVANNTKASSKAHLTCVRECVYVYVHVFATHYLCTAEGKQIKIIVHLFEVLL